MISLVCPGCGQSLDVPSTNSNCPHCGQHLSPTHSPATVAIDISNLQPPQFSPFSSEPLTKEPVATRISRAGQTDTELPVLPSTEKPNHEKTMSWSSLGPPPPQSETKEDASELTSFLAPPQKPDELGRLGSYRILKVLGAGGMGVVFHAEDLILKRPVAIKAMLPGVAAKSINRQRFLREAQAMAAVKNEHVITIYQVGVDRDVPYLAMEFLEGEPLDQRLFRETRLPAADVARIGRQTAEGLAAAHQSSLIHRDIKPGNLWLVKPRGRVVILDFGLARVAEEDESLTRTGIILGTPAYMSPEQARSKPLDPRSDLFSLGVVLYRMVTGHLPFNGPDAFAVLAALTLEDPKPVWELNPDVPYPLAKLIAQLLSKDPDERPGSAAELAQALAAVEGEMRNLTDLLAVAPPAVKKTQPSGFLDLDLGRLGLDNDDEAMEVSDLEILPDDPIQEKEIPVLSFERLGELTGHALGDYEIGPVISKGHHGLVFRARNVKSGQKTALKVLSPDFPQNEAEFQQFTKAMATALALQHPNLVSLYAAGKSGPYCWMAQEFIDGKSVAQILQELENSHKISWHLGLRVAAHITHALDFTRQHRLIHGNVTLKNILVRGSDQTVLLNDLRLLKALKGSRLQYSVMEEKLNDERTYLAPEQVDGAKSYIDFLCDIYSLGAIVYNLITGEPIFRSDSLKEAFAAIRDGTPVRPRKIQRSIPREFEFVVLRMLAKHQEDRYQSPTEVLHDLQPIIKAHAVKV